MIRITAIVLAGALFSLPAAAQTKGKSSTAPGQAGTTPGQTQTTPGGAKALAPGQLQTAPGRAKDLRQACIRRKEEVIAERL